jgi:hypothetical protein
MIRLSHFLPSAVANHPRNTKCRVDRVTPEILKRRHDFCPRTLGTHVLSAIAARGADFPRGQNVDRLASPLSPLDESWMVVPCFICTSMSRASSPSL